MVVRGEQHWIYIIPQVIRFDVRKNERGPACTKSINEVSKLSGNVQQESTHLLNEGEKKVFNVDFTVSLQGQSMSDFGSGPQDVLKAAVSGGLGAPLVHVD